jgi:hypothetical protein
MNKSLLEGLRTFLIFARICADNRLFLRKISQSDFDTLESLIKNDGVPSIPSLAEWFPDAIFGYHFSCIKGGYEPDFSFESVIFYWCNHHEGDTLVKTATVCMIDDIGKVLVSYDNEKIEVINPYKIKLRTIGESVFIHGPVLVMKKD